MSIIKCNLDFSNWGTAGARWPCRDVGAQLLAAGDIENILAERRFLPSEEIAASGGVQGELGDRGRCNAEWDGVGPSESQCEMNGEVYQLGSMQAVVADAHARGAQRGAGVPWAAKVLGGGAVGSKGEPYQSDGLGAPLAMGWHDGGRRAGVQYSTGGAIPAQGIG
ncbi:MAG: hypothetical protein GY832_22315 [Chloroflexi bacterium]|nr:hypothetical protein [Chloroflexota bacterium]